MEEDLTWKNTYRRDDVKPLQQYITKALKESGHTPDVCQWRQTRFAFWPWQRIWRHCFSIECYRISKALLAKYDKISGDKQPPADPILRQKDKVEDKVNRFCALVLHDYMTNRPFAFERTYWRAIEIGFLSQTNGSTVHTEIVLGELKARTY